MNDNIDFDRIFGLINDKGFTAEQLRAITENGNIIVSAGAGSGKTTVMIARIINKLLRGATLDEMLIVTFTRAAAQDMRVKLNEKLAVLSRDVDDRVRAAALAALEQTSVANIGTLHSYCQKLVKQYFFAANVDPAAVVCEDGEASLLKRTAVKNAITAAKEEGDASFTAVCDMLKTRRSEDGVVAVISDIVDFALSTSDPDGYLDGCKPDIEYAPALERLLCNKRAALERRIEDIARALQANDMKGYLDIVGELNDRLDGRIDGFTRLGGRKFKCETPEQTVIAERFKNLRKDCAKFRETISECEQAKTVDGMPFVKALYAVARAAAVGYAEAKARQGKIDYSDLEHGAFRVLSDDECLSSIMRNVRYVFIDEFQDVNPLQNDIAELLFRGSRSSGYTDGAESFVVGDIKQSIYGFRRCSPSHFKTAVERAEKNRDRTHISLVHNFRSSKEVVDFVNRAMSGIMTEDFGGVDYDKGDKLVCGRPNIKGGGAKLVIVPPEERKRTNADMSGAYSVVDRVKACSETRNTQAAFIADSIAEYIDEQTNIDKNSEFRLGEIAVLMRAAAPSFCTALASELKTRGIAYNFGRKSSVKSYPEAVALVDIARAVDNRLDDIALYTALRSPMGGFSDGELAEIAEIGSALISEDAPRLSYGGKQFAFIQKVEAYDGELKPRLDAFFGLLDRFARAAKVRDCGDVLGEITSAIDYFQSVYESGGQAGAVQALIDYASDRRGDLHSFLDYYDSTDFDLETDDNGDGVNITTIHSSKGLEYDFVIVADLGHKFNERDSVGKVLIDENGVFVKSPNVERRTLTKSLPYLVAGLSAPYVTRQEELRLLYVALTRAKRRLLCVACAERKEGEATEPADAKRMLDFLSHIASSPISVADYSSPAADLQTVESEDAREAVKRRIALGKAYKKTHRLSDIPIKTCVTRVAADREKASDEDEQDRRPISLTDDDRDVSVGAEKKKTGSSDARARGTAYHRAMELVDFAAVDLEKVKAACERAELVDFDDISRAVNAVSPLVNGARSYAKEKYFIFDAPSDLIFPDKDGRNGEEDWRGASVLVQGVIDLLIIDGDGKATIVDYKTGDPARLTNDGYRTQLSLYRAAVEKTTGIPVKRACLYSFVSGEFIDFEI